MLPKEDIAPPSVQADSPTSAAVVRAQIRSTADATIALLHRQVARLWRRANLNLSVGILISVVGLAIFGYFVFSAPWPTDHTEMRFEMIKRLPLVLLIEVSAFSFLSLYRASLFDIRYFLDELANVELRLVAINVALATGDLQTIRKLCEDLSKTERNFALRKDAITRDVRQAELMARRKKSLFETPQSARFRIPLPVALGVAGMLLPLVYPSSIGGGAAFLIGFACGVVLLFIAGYYEARLAAPPAKDLEYSEEGLEKAGEHSTREEFGTRDDNQQSHRQDSSGVDRAGSR